MIKAARLKKGYTQEDMAQLLEIRLSTFRNIERQYSKEYDGDRIDPRTTTALKLCLLLDLDPFKVFLSEI